MKKLLKGRQVVEPMIGLMKDGLLGIRWLKGAEGYALHSLLCGVGHNLRMILRHLLVLLLALLTWLALAIGVMLAPIRSTPSSAVC